MHTVPDSFLSMFIQLPESEVREQAQKVITGISADIIFSSSDVHATCPCCFDAFVGESLNILCSSICSGLDMKGIKESSIFLRVIIPPMLDTARITARTIVTNTNEKTIPFPTMSELTSRILTDELTKKGGLNIVSDATVAEIQVLICSSLDFIYPLSVLNSYLFSTCFVSTPQTLSHIKSFLFLEYGTLSVLTVLFLRCNSADIILSTCGGLIINYIYLEYLYLELFVLTPSN